MTADANLTLMPAFWHALLAPPETPGFDAIAAITAAADQRHRVELRQIADAVRRCRSALDCIEHPRPGSTRLGQGKSLWRVGVWDTQIRMDAGCG